MKRLIFLFAFIYPVSLLAQSNYQPGYVIKNSGDTLRGYINYRNWSISPKTIEFKDNKEEGDATHFAAADIRGFSITGMDTYVRFIGLVSMDRNKFPDLPSARDTTKAPDTTFLRELIAGNNVTLYINDDNLKTRYFIAESGSVPVELKYYQYYNNDREVVSTDIYKGQLTLYANKFAPENDRLSAMIVSCNFNQSDLKAIALLLNGNHITNAKKKSAARPFIGLAADINKIQASNLYILGNSNSGSCTAVGPKIYGGYDFFDNPNVQKFAFRAEAAFSILSPEIKFPIILSNTDTYEYYTFTQLTASIIPQFLLNVYNKPDFKFFVSVGVSFNISTFPVNKTSVKYSDPSVVQAYTIENVNSFETLWAVVPVQAGITLNKKIQVFAGYNVRLASYARSAFDDRGSYSMGFGLGYLLDNK